MDCPAKVKGEHPKTLLQLCIIILQVTTLPHGPPSLSPARGRGVPVHGAKNRPGFLLRKPGRLIMLYSCSLKPSRNHLRGFLIAAWAAARRAIGTRKGEQLT